jgi:hypothetical protein
MGRTGRMPAWRTDGMDRGMDLSPWIRRDARTATVGRKDDAAPGGDAVHRDLAIGRSGANLERMQLILNPSSDNGTHVFGHRY